MYLEFISAVTEDILSREFISDRFSSCLPIIVILLNHFSGNQLIIHVPLSSSRVLDRVMQRHIDINRHKLNEVSV